MLLLDSFFLFSYHFSFSLIFSFFVAVVFKEKKSSPDRFPRANYNLNCFSKLFRSILSFLVSLSFLGLLGCPFWVALVKVLLCAGRLFALCVQPAKQVSLLLLHSKLWENPSDSPIHINHFEWHPKAQSSIWPAWTRPIATNARMMIGKDAISNLAWTILNKIVKDLM